MGSLENNAPEYLLRLLNGSLCQCNDIAEFGEPVRSQYQISGWPDIVTEHGANDSAWEFHRRAAPTSDVQDCPPVPGVASLTCRRR